MDFFTQKIFDFHKFFNWSYLTKNPGSDLRYGSILISVFAAIVIAGLIMQIIVEKRKYPKFYKRYLKRIGDWLIYMPLLIVFLLLARLFDIGGVDSRIYLAAALAIWLIWFLYLLYYRIVVVRRFWKLYREYKGKI